FFILQINSCAAQVETYIDKDFYAIVNSHFANKKQMVLLEHTATMVKDISFLKDHKQWHQANYSLENSSFDDLDFESAFSEEELATIVEAFHGLEHTKISKENIRDNIILMGEKEFKNYEGLKSRVSAPIRITTQLGATYLLIYMDSTNGPENGYGGIYVYIKDKTGWKHIFTFGLWIS